MGYLDTKLVVCGQAGYNEGKLESEQQLLQEPKQTFPNLVPVQYNDAVLCLLKLLVGSHAGHSIFVRPCSEPCLRRYNLPYEFAKV